MCAVCWILSLEVSIYQFITEGKFLNCLIKLLLLIHSENIFVIYDIEANVAIHVQLPMFVYAIT